MIRPAQEIVIERPECEKGIGDIILSPDSPKLIAGVLCAPIALWPDDRGYFLEVQRIGVGLAAHFPKETTQISAAVNYPGIIKAFHFHRHQTDCWTPAAGMLQVVLVDLRPESATFGPGRFSSRRASGTDIRWWARGPPR
jgi:dTDP-4-dehydrorhamnose 3,5-epimerase